MTAISPAGASAGPSRRCPGCTTRVPATEFCCQPCRARMPYEYRQALSATFRRNEQAYLAATNAARRWLTEHPAEQVERRPLAEVLQDMADMLTGIGRHADHERRQVGRCAVCSCGVRVQGRLS